MSDELRAIVDGGRIAGDEDTHAGQVQGAELLNDEGGSDPSGSDGADASSNTGDAASAAESDGATPAQTEKAKDARAESDPYPVPRQALIAERKKRQEIERRLNEAIGKISAYEESLKLAQGRQEQKQKETDPDDEFFALGPAKYFAKQKQELEKHQHALREEMMGAVGKRYIELSEELTRTVHSDFDEVVDGFVDIARANPYLVQRFNASQNPAKFAYDYMKMHRDTESVGSIAELREKIRAEERAKVESELRAQSARSSAAKVSPSSASARSAGAAPVSVGDIPLKDILGA